MIEDQLFYSLNLVEIWGKVLTKKNPPIIEDFIIHPLQAYQQEQSEKSLKYLVDSIYKLFNHKNTIKFFLSRYSAFNERDVTNFFLILFKCYITLVSQLPKNNEVEAHFDCITDQYYSFAIVFENTVWSYNDGKNTYHVSSLEFSKHAYFRYKQSHTHINEKHASLLKLWLAEYESMRIDQSIKNQEIDDAIKDLMPFLKENFHKEKGDIAILLSNIGNYYLQTNQYSLAKELAFFILQKNKPYLERNSFIKNYIDALNNKNELDEFTKLFVSKSLFMIISYSQESAETLSTKYQNLFNNTNKTILLAFIHIPYLIEFLRILSETRSEFLDLLDEKDNEADSEEKTGEKNKFSQMSNMLFSTLHSIIPLFYHEKKEDHEVIFEIINKNIEYMKEAISSYKTGIQKKPIVEERKNNINMFLNNLNGQLNSCLNDIKEAKQTQKAENKELFFKRKSDNIDIIEPLKKISAINKSFS